MIKFAPLFLIPTLLSVLTVSPIQAQEKTSPVQSGRGSQSKGLSAFFSLYTNKNAHNEPYRVDPYISMAAEIQAMGEEKGREYLLLLSYLPQRNNAAFVLARMLFVPKEGKEFRPPGIGSAFCLGGSSQYAWALQPIELVDGIPFRIVEGYFFSGIQETPAQYVKDCIKNCDWNPFKFQPKTQQEKQQALKKLLASPKWKRPLDASEKEFLADQIKPEPLSVKE